MTLTKEKLMKEGMIDQRLIRTFPDEAERRAALERVWQEEHHEEPLQGEERTLEITGEIHKQEDGDVEIMNGILHGFNAAFLEESAPLKAEIQKLKKLVSDVIAVIAVISDKTVSKETVNKRSRNILINPRKLHLKNFISRKPEGEINEV